MTMAVKKLEFNHRATKWSKKSNASKMANITKLQP